MLVVRLTKRTEAGSLVMYIKVSRNPVQHFMEQAAMVAKPYIQAGWHLVHAGVE